jgi:hypothetical protein
VKAESEFGRQGMIFEEYLAMPGDTVRLRSGPYAGDIGTVLSVHPDKNHSAENSLVMVKLKNAKINSCYMGNLEKVIESPGNVLSTPADEGGKK